jgi:polyhydroxyalkanoate synthesis regulator phasin
MAFQKGRSGNPKGRPRGAGKVGELRAQIAEHVPNIVKQLIEAALKGDMQAARLLLDRVLPPLRAEDGAIKISLPDGSMAGQGEAIIKAAAMGQITPGQASAMTTALAGVARIKEISELEERIAALERAKEKK